MKRFVAMILVLFMGFPIIANANSDDTVSILLLGTDDIGEHAVTGNEEMSRSDAIFILTLQPKTKAIKILSIERDYMVELPDDIGENKLGISSYFGGPQMTLDAVNELFQLDLTQYAHIDINNLIKAIDILGGVDVEIYEEELDEVNLFIDSIMTYTDLKNVVAGMNHLGGPEAWAFLGVRDNDIQAVESNSARSDRQRRVMIAFLDMFYKLDFTEVVRFANEIIPLIKTNLTLSAVLSIIKAALTCDLEKIAYMRTPTGEYQLKRVSMHSVVIVDDMQQEIKQVHQFLYN